MQRFLREGRSSPVATQRADIDHDDNVALPGRDGLNGRTSTSSSDQSDDSSPSGPATSNISSPATSLSTHRDIPLNIGTDSQAGDPRQGIDQSVDLWRTRLEHLYYLLDNFQHEFDAKLQELRAGIPLSSRAPQRLNSRIPRQSLNLLAHYGRTVPESSESALRQLDSDRQHLAATPAVSALYASAGKSNVGDGDGMAVQQPSPSSSLMGFFEPSSTEAPSPLEHDSSRGEQGPGSLLTSSPLHDPPSSSEPPPGAFRASLSSSSSSSPISTGEELTQTPDNHDKAVISGYDTSRKDSPAEYVAAALTAQKAAVKSQHHHRRRHSRGEVIIDWQRFHTENCREPLSQLSSCNTCLGWRRGFDDEQAAATRL